MFTDVRYIPVGSFLGLFQIAIENKNIDTELQAYAFFGGEKMHTAYSKKIFFGREKITGF